MACLVFPGPGLSSGLWLLGEPGYTVADNKADTGTIAPPKPSPCALRITGTVIEAREWAPRDEPTNVKRTITLTYDGGRYTVHVDARDKTFASLGEGQTATLEVPFFKHDRDGWKAERSREPVLVKVGA